MRSYLCVIDIVDDPRSQPVDAIAVRTVQQPSAEERLGLAAVNISACIHPVATVAGAERGPVGIVIEIDSKPGILERCTGKGSYEL